MAVSHAQAQLLLRDFGARAGLEDLALDEAGYCCLLFGERIVVDLDHDEAGERLLLSAFLGRAAEPGPLQASLLEANFLGQGTGGATLSLHEASGGVVLWRELPLNGLDVDRLDAVVKAFVAAAERWIGAVAAEPAIPPAEIAAPRGGMPSELMIRA